MRLAGDHAGSVDVYGDGLFHTAQARYAPHDHIVDSPNDHADAGATDTGERTDSRATRAGSRGCGGLEINR
jgi:hypothetical protein